MINEDDERALIFGVWDLIHLMDTVGATLVFDKLKESSPQHYHELLSVAQDMIIKELADIKQGSV